MLHEFIEANRKEIISRTSAMVLARHWPAASPGELENGIPLFLTQLTETLRRELETPPFPDDAIGSTAARHGRELLGKGFTLSQVVHDYGDVCQAITELAVQLQAPITTKEFHTLNRCLDTAIAEAVTEYGRLQDVGTARNEAERMGQVAHDLSNKLHVAMLSFHVLRAGKVGISGSVGDVLGRSLDGLRDLIATALAEVRQDSRQLRRDRVSLGALIDEIAVGANLQAGLRGVAFTAESVDPTLLVEVDPPVLAAAVMSLLKNAFKYTPEKGRVTLRTRRENGSIAIEVEDQCGGMAVGNGDDPSRSFGDRRAKERSSGLERGLAGARKAARENGGEIHIRNLPGKGCIFGIQLPLALAVA